MFKKAILAPNAPKAIGPYSAGIKLGDFVYISGQLPADPQTGDLVGNTAKEQAEQSLKNLEAVLDGLGLETRHVVKTTIYLADMNDFAAVNEVYGKHFSEPYPARSCVQVAALPKGALLEIEAFAVDTLHYEQQQSACQGTCQSCEGDCSGECGH